MIFRTMVLMIFRMVVRMMIFRMVVRMMIFRMVRSKPTSATPKASQQLAQGVRPPQGLSPDPSVSHPHSFQMVLITSAQLQTRVAPHSSSLPDCTFSGEKKPHHPAVTQSVATTCFRVCRTRQGNRRSCP